MIDPAAILGYVFPEQAQEYSPRDAILYALGLGLGRDPLDVDDLRFLDERQLSVMPTFAVTLCSPGMWIRDPALGVDFTRLVHLAHDAEFLGPLSPAARMTGTAKVIALGDRGPGRGAELVLERTIAEGNTIRCRLRQTLLLRGDGGYGGPAPERLVLPQSETEPDARIEIATSPRAALIYRLSGDWNPLHLDPAVAQAASFPRPILQGLASYGIAGVAVSRALSRAPEQVTRLACRFAGVVLPGDRIEFLAWRKGARSAQFVGMVDGHEVLADGQISWEQV